MVKRQFAYGETFLTVSRKTMIDKYPSLFSEICTCQVLKSAFDPNMYFTLPPRALAPWW